MCFLIVAKTEVTIKKEVLAFEEIVQNKVTTEHFVAEITGKYEKVEEKGITVLNLEEDASVSIKPGKNSSCLFNIIECAETGLTARFNFKIEKLVENTYFVSSGAESVERQGVVMLFRFNQFHVVFSTETNYWFVSFAPTLVKTGEFTTFEWSFSKQEGLSVFVNNAMVGRMVEANERVVTATSIVSEEIVIGKASVSTVEQHKSKVTTQEVLAFTVSREVLMKQGYAVEGMH